MQRRQKKKYIFIVFQKNVASFRHAKTAVDYNLKALYNIRKKTAAVSDRGGIMNEGKLTIFLAHSHKDEEKVRKIRNVLEILECEPLIFFLKCLDDNNVELEDFIKREIEARNVFIYCKSDNAEKSEWVKKELEYIRSFDKSRLYEIDVEKDFKEGLIDLIKRIAEIIRSNRIFISCSNADRSVRTVLTEYLKERDLQIFEFEKEIRGFCDYAEEVDKEISRISKEGVFVYLCSQNSLNSPAVKFELEKAVGYGAKIVPVMIKGTDASGKTPPQISDKQWIPIDGDPTPEQLKTIYCAVAGA